MIELYFQKIIGQEIRPLDVKTAAYLEKLEAGESFKVKRPVKVRKYWNHKRFFLMLEFVRDNLREDLGQMTQEALRESLIVSAGHYTLLLTFIDGNRIELRKAKSMSFDNMDDDEFKVLYNDCIDAACKYYINDDQELLRNFIHRF